VGKFGGCAFAARFFAGFNWRESGAIGSLMSCKGYIYFFIAVLYINNLNRLVELIVLNVGLSAGILSRVKAIFV
jgi:Kef-type K+ transport system membrane component KefB